MVGAVSTGAAEDFAASAETGAVAGASVVALDETEVSGAGLTVGTTAGVDVAGTAGEVTVFLVLPEALVVDSVETAVTAAEFAEGWPAAWSNSRIF